MVAYQIDLHEWTSVKFDQTEEFFILEITYEDMYKNMFSVSQLVEGQINLQETPVFLVNRDPGWKCWW